MAVSNSGMTLYTSNDTAESWTGTDGLDSEVKIQGTGSQSFLVGKNSDETGILALSASMGTPKYFTLYSKCDVYAFYTAVYIQLESTTNNFEEFTISTNAVPDVSGDFRASVNQIGQGTSTGTYVPNSHTIMRYRVDNSASGNIRAITNTWIDCMYYGNGRTISGTTTGDKLFQESDDLDKSGDTYDGCSETYKGSLSYQTDVTVSTTTGNSYGEVVTWAYGRNTDNSYSLTVTGTADFQNTILIGGAGTVQARIGLDTSSATSFAMSGGGVTNGGAIVLGSGQTISGVVFSNCTSFTVPNTLTNCTITGSGLLTLTGSITGGTISNPTGASAVSASTLNNITGVNFISDGSSHAVDLGTISTTTSMDWNNSFSGYAVVDGSTGNEVIKVNVDSGQTLTINSSSGTPSVYNTGAGTVNVVSGQVTFTLTVKDTAGAIIQGAMVYVTADAGGGLAEGTVIIDKQTTDVNGQVSDTRSLGSNQPIIGRVRKSTSAPYYKTAAVVGTISSTAGLDLTVQMIGD